MSGRKIAWWSFGLWLCGALASFGAELLKIGDNVPDFPQTAEWHSGNAQKINEFGDKKLLVLYFAKPGCPSCDDFAPHLLRLLVKNSADLRVVMIAPGIYPADDVQKYVAERQLGDYPVMRDADQSFAPRFIGKVDKFPYVAIVKKDGANAKLAWFGRAKFHAQITAEVRRALARPAEKTSQENLLDGNPQVLLVGAEKSFSVTTPLLSPLKDCARIAETLKKKNIRSAVCGSAGKPVTVGDFTKFWENSLTAPAAESAGRKIVLYYSGDALAETLDSERTDIAFRLADGAVKLSDMVKKIPADTGFSIIIDAMHADRFAGLDDRAADDYLFPDIIKSVGAAFPNVAIMLSAARWDKSLLAEATGGTLFARYLAEELAKPQVASAENLWRTLRDRLADYGRRTGLLQSPAFICVKK